MILFRNRVIAATDMDEFAKSVGGFIRDQLDAREARIANLEKRIDGLTKEVERLKSAPRMSLRQRLMERGIK